MEISGLWHLGIDYLKNTRNDVEGVAIINLEISHS